MNIFFLHKDPKICAAYHCDKHVVKMILESTQMLCSSIYITNNIYKNKELNNELKYKLFKDFPRKSKNGDIDPYKLSHINHPCTKWSRECIENWDWLLLLAKNLCFEYTLRYNKIHACYPIIQWLEKNKPNLPTFGKITKPAQAMPNDCKNSDSVKAYRNYYINYKLSFCKWTNTKIPLFVKNHI